MLNAIRIFHMILTTHQTSVCGGSTVDLFEMEMENYIRKLIIRQVSRTWPCVPSDISRLQRLVGPIVLHSQIFLDACQKCASIKGSGFVTLYVTRPAPIMPA